MSAVLIGMSPVAQTASQDIRAGVLADWPPYYVPAGDKASGFAVDVLDAIAASEGLSVSYRVYDGFPDMFDALDRGEIDVIPSLGMVAGREFIFTPAIDAFRISLFVRTSTPEVHGIDDLAGKSLGVVYANIGEQLAKDVKGVDLVVHHEVAEALLRLLTGDIDGLIYPVPVVKDLARQANVQHQLREVLPPLAEVKRAMAVSKGNPELGARLSAAVEAFLGTPAFKEIYARWHPPEEPWLTVRRAVIIGSSILVAIVILLVAWRYVTIRRLNRELVFRARLLDVIEEAVVAVDGSGNITYWNRFAEALYGWSGTELLGRPIVETMPAEISEGVFRQISNDLQQGRSWQGDLNMVNRSGRGFPALVTIAPMFEPGGQVAGWVSVSRDLSEHKELEKQLQQAQKMEAIGRLAGGVAHDFNNLLTVIKGHTELAMEDAQAGSSIRNDLAEVNQTVDRATSLVRQLLTFSRRQPLQPEVLNVAELIAGFRSMLKRILREDIDLKVELEEELWRVRADRGQLEQVLMNLAINAGDAMPGGGALNITAKNVPAIDHGVELVEISVADTGVGMTPEIRDRVFEPFFTTREASGGTGLGLAMVHGIVSQSGGTIGLESEPGKGTTFRIRLPRCTDDQAKVEAETEAGPGRNAEAVIMVVEDEEAVRNLVTRLLSNEGYEVIAVDDPLKALSDSRLDRVDLLISDIVMPGMKGPELAKRIQERRPGMPVLLMTGYARDEPLSLNAGDQILAKPFSQTDLSSRVRELLTNKSV